MKFFITLICVMTLGGPVWADVGRDEAGAIAQRISAGRVLAIEKTVNNGRNIWRVKVLTQQGEVKVLLIDASSGRTL